MVRLGMAAAALAMMAAPLFAQESTEQLKKELEQLRAEVDGLKAVNATREVPGSGKISGDAMAADDSPITTMLKGTKLSGFVDAGYVVNFNGLHSTGAPFSNSSGPNGVHAFDNRDNSFYLHEAHLTLERLATKDMIVGYHIELVAGNDPSIYDGTILQEGWMQIMVPVMAGLDIKIGKMATMAGYEVLENINNMNYSRGLLFALIQPFTSTGVRATLNFTDQYSATMGFSNGYNATGSFADADHGKQFELNVTAKPMKDLMLATTILIGNDTSALNAQIGGKYWLWDLVIEWKMDKLTVGLNFDWFSANHVLGTTQSASTRGPLSGIALYTKYAFTDVVSQALRFEYYSNTNGWSVPVDGGLGQNPGNANDSGTGSRVFELSLTTEVKVASQLILRFEIRTNNSNNHNFTRDGRAARGDTTFGIEAIMPF